MGTVLDHCFQPVHENCHAGARYRVRVREPHGPGIRDGKGENHDETLTDSETNSRRRHKSTRFRPWVIARGEIASETAPGRCSGSSSSIDGVKIDTAAPNDRRSGRRSSARPSLRASTFPAGVPVSVCAPAAIRPCGGRNRSAEDGHSGAQERLLVLNRKLHAIGALPSASGSLSPPIFETAPRKT